MTRLWNWGVGLATVYTIFAGATLGFVTFAMSERVDLVSPDYYANALEHDARQAASARGLALGDAFQIDVTADGHSLSIAWPDMARPESGRVRLYRPSNAGADRTEPVLRGGGRQSIALTGVAPGLWTVQCEWVASGVRYYGEKQIVIR
jgi:hypothetical protein